MAQLQNSSMILTSFIPAAAFVAGLTGSLHCVGMCGGLVTASCHTRQDIFRYQLGRLTGYLLLGLIGAMLGQVIAFKNFPELSLVSGILLGLIFIYWGLKPILPWPKKNLKPGVLDQLAGKIYGRLWKKFLFKNNGIYKSFFTGLFSLFLPCGLLYAVLLSQIALAQSSGHHYQLYFSMGFFWLGTLPAMLLAPGLFHTILRPLKAKMPKAFSMVLIVIGLSTISYRLMQVNAHGASMHDPKKHDALKCH